VRPFPLGFEAAAQDSARKVHLGRLGQEKDQHQSSYEPGGISSTIYQPFIWQTGLQGKRCGLPAKTSTRKTAWIASKRGIIRCTALSRRLYPAPSHFDPIKTNQKTTAVYEMRFAAGIPTLSPKTV